MAYISKKKFTNVNKDYIEILILRLYIHGYSEKEIVQFLDINSYILSKKINSVFRKYKTDNWCKIIEIAIKKKNIIIEDFVDDIVKNLAEIYAELIIEHSPIKNPNLNSNLYEYYITCISETFKHTIKNHDYSKLTKKEIELIQLSFDGDSKETIGEALKINHLQLEQKSKVIIKKLKVKNWVSVIKIAFVLKIINKPIIPYQKIEKQIKISSKFIKTQLNISSLKSKEKKSIIYSHLIELYAEVEFKNIFNTQA